MNRIDFKLPYEAPIAESFTLSAAPLNICVQFSGDADSKTLKKAKLSKLLFSESLYYFYFGTLTRIQ